MRPAETFLSIFNLEMHHGDDVSVFYGSPMRYPSGRYFEMTVFPPILRIITRSLSNGFTKRNYE